ncbi:MAG: hypothetical protein ABIA97_04410 [Candidatus Omnitrophota bacterium]
MMEERLSEVILMLNLILYGLVSFVFFPASISNFQMIVFGVNSYQHPLYWMLGVILAICYLISAIGLYSSKAWARKIILTLVIPVTFINSFGAIVFSMIIRLGSNASEGFLLYPDKSTLQYVTMVVEPIDFLGVIPCVLLCFFLICYLTHPKVKEQFSAKNIGGSASGRK